MLFPYKYSLLHPLNIKHRVSVISIFSEDSHVRTLNVNLLRRQFITESVRLSIYIHVGTMCVCM